MKISCMTDHSRHAGPLSSRCSRHQAVVSTVEWGLQLPEQVSRIPTDGQTWIKKENFAGCGGRQAGRQVRGWLPGRCLLSLYLPIHPEAVRGYCALPGRGGAVHEAPSSSERDKRLDGRQTDELGTPVDWVTYGPVAGGWMSSQACWSLHQSPERCSCTLSWVVSVSADLPTNRTKTVASCVAFFCCSSAAETFSKSFAISTW